MKKAIQFLAALTLLLIGMQTNAFAQRVEADKTLSPYFFVQSESSVVDQLPLQSTGAEVDIAGVIANVIVSQVYKNDGDTPLEAIYVFPASTRAAIYGLDMTIGNRTIHAQIEERDKARKQYNDAKSEGKRATLLEQQRPNVFQMNVANIMPGDVIEVTLKYTELLIPEQGIYEFIYPTVVGPRYSNQQAKNASDADQFVATPYQSEGQNPTYTFDLEVYLSMGMPIQYINCPTHKVNINHESLDQAAIKLDGSEIVGGNRDYILQYSLSGGQVESGVLLYEHGDEQFFLAMMQPPKRVEENQIPPREYVFVVDVSGSMGGFPLNISKTLLRNLITGLRASDRFNVLLFAGTSGWLAEESLEANSSNITKAVNVIDNQRGGGGTELLPALRKAINMPRCESNLSRSIIVVTDGYISVEREAFDLISNNLNQANLFAFGIGSSVNRQLIEGMAHVGGGQPLIITEQAKANEQAEKFRQYINRPVLTQVTASYDGLAVYDVIPSSLPDVMAERPVILFGKYKGDASKGKIRIHGQTSTGTYHKTFDLSTIQASKRNAALRSLWAREKIKWMDDYKSVDYSNNNKEAVTKIGLDYSLMTAYTSFVAIDNEVIANENGKSEKVKQPLPLPQGVSNAAVGFDMAIEGIVHKPKKKKKPAKTVVLQLSNIKALSGHLPVDFKGMIQEKIDVLSLKVNHKNSLPFTNIRIDIQLNKTGKVVKVVVDGDKLDEHLVKELEDTIGGWQFVNSKLEGEVLVRFEVVVM